jgi:hypothetical protein
MSKCIINDCPNESASRGLCHTCRKAAKTAILHNQVTEEQLLDAGMILPVKASGRKPQSAFIKQLRALQDANI